VISPCLEFEMDSNEAVALGRLAGWTLTSGNGQSWLTKVNDRRDYWLEPGECHLIRGSGKVVLVCWPTAGNDVAFAATIRISPPAASIGHRHLLPQLTLRKAALARATERGPHRHLAQP